MLWLLCASQGGGEARPAGESGQAARGVLPCQPGTARPWSTGLPPVQKLVQRIGPLLFIAVSAAGFWYAGARSLEPGHDRVEVSWLIPSTT